MLRRAIVPALEAHASPALESFSLEEEELMIAEAPQDAADATAELAAAERTLDLSEALEDLAVIADTIEEPTPAEAALVDSSAQMAVAGTDIQPEEIVPSLESFVGKKISQEGIVDKIKARAKAIWEAIQNMLKSIWEKVEGYFYKILGNVPRLRKNIETLEKVIAELGDKTEVEKKFTVSSGVAALSVNKVPVKGAKALTDALKDTEKALAWSTGEYITRVISVADVVSKHIADFEPAKAEEVSASLIKGLNSAGGSFKPVDSKKTTIQGWAGYETFAGDNLLGNVRLVGKYNKSANDASGNSILGTLEKYRRATVSLDQVESDAKVPDSVEFDTMSADEMKAVLKEAKAILDKVEDFKRGEKAKKLAKARDDMKAASSKAATAAGKLEKGSEDGAQVAVLYYRGIINFNLSYARWAKEPAMAMISNSLNSVRASLNVVGQSLKQYKKPEAK